MKACFQIAECSFSSANILNISLSCKFLGDLLSILRKFAENKPDNLRKLMGRGGWRWVGDFFTKMDEGGEKGEEEERRYSCDSCDSCDSFQGRGI